MRLALAALLTSLLLPFAAAYPCGAPVVAVPGKPGTALFEGSGQISAFTVTDGGLSWDRMDAPGWSDEHHVADIDGDLSGAIETDARVERAISAQKNVIVEIGPGGTSPISTDSLAATTVFGAALDANQNWNVLTYAASSEQIALYSESAPGLFLREATGSGNCGAATMLDLVVEPDGSRVGICGGQAVVVAGTALQLVSLPTPALALGRSSSGLAVFYGNSADGTTISQMSHTAGSLTFTTTATIVPPQPAAWFIATSETSFVASLDAAGDEVIAYTLSNGNWVASQEFYGSPLLSAAGSPALILTGTFQLVIGTQASDGSWTTGQLAVIGSPPAYAGGTGGIGCASGGSANLLGLAMLAVALLAMRLQRARRLARAPAATE